MTSQSRLEELFNQMIEEIDAEFSDIAIEVQLRFTPSGAVERLRIFLVDESFIDVWLSLSGKYSYHWEQRPIRGLIYRHDNAPHSNGRNSRPFQSISMTVKKTE